MSRMVRLSLVLVIIVCCVGCDRATKHIARQTLASAPPISLLGDSVRFEYVENSGAFLGLGSNLPGIARVILFIIFSGAGLLVALGYIFRVDGLELMPTIGLSLLAGGGLGNLADRIANNGAVTDFVRLGIGPLRTGIFNMADLAIVAGVLALGLWSAFGAKQTSGIPEG
jgi:signal peptidase II